VSCRAFSQSKPISSLSSAPSRDERSGDATTPRALPYAVTKRASHYETITSHPSSVALGGDSSIASHRTSTSMPRSTGLWTSRIHPRCSPSRSYESVVDNASSLRSLTRIVPVASTATDVNWQRRGLLLQPAHRRTPSLAGTYGDTVPLSRRRHSRRCQLSDACRAGSRLACSRRAARGSIGRHGPFEPRPTFAPVAA